MTSGRGGGSSKGTPDISELGGARVRRRGDPARERAVCRRSLTGAGLTGIARGFPFSPAAAERRKKALVLPATKSSEILTFRDPRLNMTVCGLLKNSQEPVPLQSISVDVVVHGFVADVVSELRYKNEEKNPVEVTFVFPLDDEAAVYAFEGLIGGSRIEAQIREKEKAQQEYQDALSEGRQTFLLEREANTSDIFTCTLGNLPPDGEATLKLRYVQALAPEPDGAVRFVLPAVLNPRYVPQGSEGDTVTKSIPRVPRGKLPYTLSLSATLESSQRINRVESKCNLEPLRYTAEDHTAAQVSLADGHQFDRDVELLIYYEEVHKPSAIFEAGKPGAASGSLMGDPALLVTLYPSLRCVSKPGLSATGEFLFLLDRSGSMDCVTDYNTPNAPLRIQSAKETLILLLKSLPLGCFFNIYGFGSTYDSFYPKSVEYTQKTMSDSLKRVQDLRADLGGTEILQPLKAIYSQPCQEGHPRQLFVFTDGEVFNTEEVIAEVRRHSGSHRCFSFGIGEGASTALIKGIARAAGGSAEFITGKERMQAKALQSLKKALQPVVTGISLRWDLPSGFKAELVGSGPQVIFEGQHSLVFAQIRGKQKSSSALEGSAVLQYNFQDQSFKDTVKFPLQAQESDRLPVHRLAARALLQDLEGTGEKDKKKQRLALETSLSSGVVCSQTAYVGVNKELGQPVQGPLVFRGVPHARPCASMPAQYAYRVPGRYAAMPVMKKRCARAAPVAFSRAAKPVLSRVSATLGYEDDEPALELEDEEEESPLLKLVSLQNADGSWVLDSNLASVLGLKEADIMSKTPEQVPPSAWATVLAILWLHSRAAEQRDEWELLEAKALNWLQASAGSRLAECVKTGNAVLGSSVSPQTFGL
ncbi:von Willebrand factor A domain-containing protein 5A isoform X1 [Sphaerodactylus townsendi]|uniref:von Willebrand factor A domain-containing protein 5A isoform X1 n=2 Tax=Sphaerodactylus townsendi TaxID=933632 RepID=UPI002026B8D2|nr:von Willebrand factor A domain-containing protein 5A isoform X1 [Sphaerodactylus townsendi]